MQESMAEENAEAAAEEDMLLDLPQEIILEILHRIPPKSLVQVKAVCKPWFQLISDRNFAHDHLIHPRQHSYSIEEEEESAVILEICCREPYFHNYYSINFQDFQLKQFKIYLELQEQIKDQVLLRASCDGLLLLQSKRNANQLYICNPITRNCKTLPLLETRKIIWNFALVLDCSVDPMYKVVGITMSSKTCFVFKLREIGSQWKELITPYRDSQLLSRLPLVMVNKELHWLVMAYSPRSNNESKPPCYKPCIYSVNAAKEELRFRETYVPSMIKCVYDCNSVLEVKGSLGLTDPVSCCNQLDIWTLHHRDETDGQWTKTYSIRLDSEIGNRPRVHSFPDSSYLLIRYKNRLLFYDLENKDSRKVDLENMDSRIVPVSNEGKLLSRFQFVHTDSLVKWN